jgi:hypothetical protein
MAVLQLETLAKAADAMNGVASKRRCYSIIPYALHLKLEEHDGAFETKLN